MTRQIIRRVAAVFMAISALLSAPAALAQNDRIIDTPTGWAYLYGANSSQMNNVINDGFRPFSMDRVGTGLYDVVFVHNSGSYNIPGATYTLGRSPSSLATYLSDNNYRLLDLEVYDSGGSTFMSAIVVPNSGPSGTPAWGWLYNTSFSAINTWLSDNPSLRLIDLDVYTIGGTQYYSAVAVHNSGNNAQGWWYYAGVTASQITTELTNNDARLVSIDLISPGSLIVPATYACIMVSGNPGGGWWYSSLTTEQISALLAQNGARLTCLHRYTNFLGDTRWAVAMVDNANPQTRRMRAFMGNALTQGSYGFMLKQVGGPVLASLNENFAFEPASMLKILNATYAIRQCSLGLDALANDIFIRDKCNPNECPDTVQCNAGNEDLDDAIRLMMENSDNNRTWEIENRYTRTTLNNFAASRGLTNTMINHRLGCLCGMPFNTFSCVDAVSLYEQIADGSLFNEGWKDTLFNLMLDLDEQGYGWYPTLSAVINQEAASTNLTASEITTFRNAVRFANKGGGYGCGDSRWRTEGAWASIPFKVLLLGTYVTIDREYAIATFVHDGRDPGANIAYQAKEEILREQIRAALESWDVACTSPGFFSQPDDDSAPLGGTASFSVILYIGNGSTSYQWQKQLSGGGWSNLSNGARISGATSSQLTISNIIASDAANYRVIATRACGSATSTAAALTISEPCPADWDGSGGVNSNDISAFLTAWLGSVQGGTLVADFNNDNAVNSNDISAFLTAWLNAVQNGC